MGDHDHRQLLTLRTVSEGQPRAVMRPDRRFSSDLAIPRRTAGAGAGSSSNACRRPSSDLSPDTASSSARSHSSAAATSSASAGPRWEPGRKYKTRPRIVLDASCSQALVGRQIDASAEPATGHGAAHFSRAGRYVGPVSASSAAQGCGRKSGFLPFSGINMEAPISAAHSAIPRRSTILTPLRVDGWQANNSPVLPVGQAL